MIKIFGIIYGNKTTEYTPYRNTATEKLWRFENNCMIDIVDNKMGDLSDSDIVGVLSWKFPQKAGVTRVPLMEKLKFAPKWAEVYNLSPRLSPPNGWSFMEWSDQGHKGIRSMIQRVCKHVGLRYQEDPRIIVYANQFLARKSIYCDYVNNIIKPALELLEGEMWEEVNRPSGYTRAMDAEKLKELTGLEFYNYIPFIAERLMIQYIADRQPKTIQVL